MGVGFKAKPVFFTLFVIGAVAFLTMAILSFGHVGSLRGGHHSLSGGGHAHSLPAAHVGHIGPGHGGGATVVRGGGGAVRAAGGPAVRGSGGRGIFRAARWSWLMVTPIDLASLCLGFGAAGIILGHSLGGAALIWVAAACAIAYNMLLIKPAMNFALKFVSRESKGLEGMVAGEALAVGHFDAQGRGIVKLTLDGQIVQLLATLDPSEVAKGIEVTRGDRLCILEVDPARNTCRVSRELAA